VKNVKSTNRFDTLVNERSKIINGLRTFFLAIARFILVVGIAYVIISPLIGVLMNSLFSNDDHFNPMVYLIPQYPTLERYRVVMAANVMDYWRVLGRNTLYVVSLAVIQVAVCSFVGYGFARFQFPLKKLLFAFVIIMIVTPMHTIMLPLFMTFQAFDPFGLVTAATGQPYNMLGSIWPMYMMTLLGAGLCSGLYIFIFNQFFRGLPKEIEEAAEIDGAGSFGTYWRVMIPNALPAIVTVLIFSIVWQYNDKFFAQLFTISPNIVLSKHLSGLGATVGSQLSLQDPSLTTLYIYAGVILAIIPLILIYVILQKQFIEGVERSGIVG
jgi:multiple sugar transport system permease protein